MRIHLDPQREEVLAGLELEMKGDGAGRAKFLGVKGNALEAATDANLSVRTSGTSPAIHRYSGVLYDALDVSSLSATARRRLDGAVLIFSGLWGLVAPSDPIPNYKLKMGARLPRLGAVARFWRRPITEALEEAGAGRRIWDLLPNEHAAAWEPSETTERCAVRFLDRRADGTLVAVSHHNKALKGRFVRVLLAQPQLAPEDLADVEPIDGYVMEPTLTERQDGRTLVAMVRRT
jgi:cytoplasmic iron level regulating protein YaaA (DUF328/UPF0246 family)